MGWDEDGVLNWLVAINPDAGHLDRDSEHRHDGSLSTAADAILAPGRGTLIGRGLAGVAGGI